MVIPGRGERDKAAGASESHRCAEELLISTPDGRTTVPQPGGSRRPGHLPSQGRPGTCRCRGRLGITKAIESAGYWHGGLEVQELLAWFGVRSSISHAPRFLKAIGVDPYHQYGGMNLGAADLLVSERRERIIESRERYLHMGD